MLLSEDGRIVLTDFELSKEIANNDGEEATTSMAKAGTRGFMAPEVNLYHWLKDWIINQLYETSLD